MMKYTVRFEGRIYVIDTNMSREKFKAILIKGVQIVERKDEGDFEREGD